MGMTIARNGPLRFVFVGHVDERKGADVLRDAVMKLAGRRVPCELTIIGNYTSAIRFDGLVNVKSLGWIPQDRLADELAKYDVLVLPSRHDSFGMVVAEAMACGLPVIVSDHVGAKEMVEPQVNGLVVLAGDAIALAGAMEWFITNRERISTMIPATRQAAARYTWQVYQERVLWLVRQFASEPAAKRAKHD
jgi:glycosyltransferase involved in cell wall biosynthesis